MKLLFFVWLVAAACAFATVAFGKDNSGCDAECAGQATPDADVSGADPVHPSGSNASLGFDDYSVPTTRDRNSDDYSYGSNSNDSGSGNANSAP